MTVANTPRRISESSSPDGSGLQTVGAIDPDEQKDRRHDRRGDQNGIHVKKKHTAPLSIDLQA